MFLRDTRSLSKSDPFNENKKRNTGCSQNATHPFLVSVMEKMMKSQFFF